MLPRHITALGQALACARVDEAAAIRTVLDVALDATDAREARLLLLQGGAVEIWRLRADGEVTLAVALDGGDDNFSAWRDAVVDTGTHVVLTASLPLAPGVDAGLLAVEVPASEATVQEAAAQLDHFALHAASIASVGRADLERRIAVSAATNDDQLVKARQHATMLQRRAKWATNALDLAAHDPSFTEDAATHVTELSALVDDLVADLGAAIII